MSSVPQDQTIRAYAANEVNGSFEQIEYNPGPLGADQVEIDVHACGICHSDLSMLDNEWGMTAYPFVPGHEAAGVVARVGEGVKHLSVGQRVGLGWHSGYCNHCTQCFSGDHNLCARAEASIVGRHGGFGNKVRAQAAAVVALPDAIDLADAGPLFCGGITVFSPMLEFDVRPTDRVAVIGIGGLGHMALQFLNAWGCEVTAFTSSESKREQAIQMGAHHTLNSRDAEELKSAAGRFDFIISTVNVKLDWNLYINTLAPKGRLHIVGATLEPMDLAAFPMISGQRSVSGSPVGSPAAIATMLDFAARHKIKPVIEKFSFDKVNEAMDHLRAGKARYRVVLTND